PKKTHRCGPAGRPKPEPGSLGLRCGEPRAIESQHRSGVVLGRVTRFFGWPAVGGGRLRQAPLRRREKPPQRPGDPEAAERIAAGLPEITDENLRAALGRLGAAIKQS